MRVLPGILIASIVGIVGASRAARADGKYHPVPGGDAHLQLRVLKYDGEVNGLLTVEVKNPSKRIVSFTARGLYFVPDGDPDRAPQRLGAVGPMQIGDAHQDEVRVPAGGTVEVQLDVFCVDDHRDAPTPQTAFTLARHRMPAALTQTIDHETRAAATSAGGFGSAGAAEPVQEEVWKARDKRWVKLDGEGAQETDKGSDRMRPQEELRYKNDERQTERLPEPDGTAP